MENRRAMADAARLLGALAALFLGGCAATPELPYDPYAPHGSAVMAPVASVPAAPAPPPAQVPLLPAAESPGVQPPTPYQDRPSDVSPAGHVQPAALPKTVEIAPPPHLLHYPALLPADETSERGLTLDQIINAVLVSDPKLRADFEVINQANAEALTASLRPNPTLFTDIQLLPLTRPFTPTLQGGPPQQDIQVGYSIDWFLFGKRAANMAAAAHGVRASVSEFEDRVRLRVLEASLAFYDVLEAKGLHALSLQDVANLERAEAAVKKTVVAGGRAEVDLKLIRLDLLRSRQTLRDAVNHLAQAKLKLRAMIGRTDADPDFDVGGTLEKATGESPPPPEEAFRMALENRPDMIALRAKVDKARANTVVEYRNAYPTVTPLFGYTRQYQTQAIGFPDANSWGAAVTMTLPIFDRNQGNRAKAASLLTQNQREYQAALANLRMEVESAAQEFRTASANAEAIAADQLKLAREVLASITAVYQAGGRPLVDLLVAQRNFRETYRAYITARAAYWRAVYRYSAAIGRKVNPE